jgi:hypothetical protein
LGCTDQKVEDFRRTKVTSLSVALVKRTNTVTRSAGQLGEVAKMAEIAHGAKIEQANAPQYSALRCIARKPLFNFQSLAIVAFLPIR